MLLALTATAGVLSHSSFEALNDDGTFFFFEGGSLFCERVVELCVFVHSVCGFFLLHLQKKSASLVVHGLFQVPTIPGERRQATIIFGPSQTTMVMVHRQGTGCKMH